MPIRSLLLAVLCSLLAGSVLFAQDPPDNKNAELLKAIQTLDTAFEKQDKDAIRKLTDPNHISIAPTYQFFNQEDQLKALPELKISVFKSGPKRIIRITPETALVAYEANLEGTYAGKKLPGRVQIVESWVRRRGKWMETSYQETPLP
ncbi:nuclear transport factor 2 family protein [uncultured Gimesia sp.]|jgi:hypothetical protein|uniref:nuclear transport factor 2 family protein n=1 Tax=uncultured Gimesia sp. TaxID=1678688 RepID=UPI002610EFA7|nr:nuclear transport factor 2 family protein [uncultured Gimesia sp.]